jgi:DNA-binding response OmpR family regulator
MRKDEIVSPVLLIVRDWTTRAMIAAQLEEAGYAISEVESIPPTAQLAQARLIVFDSHDQPLDAASLARLRRAAASIPVIVCSGPYDLAQFDFRAEGFPHVLVRPFTIQNLVDKIEDVLRKSTAR